MATRVRLTADIDPELRRQVKIAAASNDKSVSAWIEDVIRNELQDHGGGGRVVYIGDTRVSLPPPGARPRGSKNPVQLRGTGGTVADAVIEDRR